MNTKRSYKKTNNGLVLTGGGARAAYQVGVLSAIAKFMPRHHGSPFPILCGTSAGAINTTALACYSSCFQLGVKKLEWVWKNLKTNHIYYSDISRVFGHILRGFISGFQADYAGKQAHSLLNNAPLAELLKQIIDYQRIEHCINKDFLTALSVTASSYSSGDSISFYQSDTHIAPWYRAKRRGSPCNISTEHLMASAAIPIVFPSYKLRSEHYGDGSIHQLSPLSPAIHLGAERIFIVGVEQPKNKRYAKENNPHPPTTSTIAGHLLDSIFSDTLQSDLERMHRINDTLDLVPQDAPKTTSPLKKIESFVINPSHNFNSIACEHYDDLPFAIKVLLRSVGISNNMESSLLSYLLFEKNYCKKLIKLGYEDALQQETKIKEFLSL